MLTQKGEISWSSITRQKIMGKKLLLIDEELASPWGKLPSCLSSTKWPALKLYTHQPQQIASKGCTYIHTYIHENNYKISII